MPATGQGVALDTTAPVSGLVSPNPHPTSGHSFAWLVQVATSLSEEKGGAAWGTRTHDPIITNDVLYQLS